MAEGAQRLASLVVVGGALKDRRLDLEEVVTEVLIGSDGDCHLHVDLPGISPIHARIWADLDGATAHDTHAPRGLFVNDDKVEGEAPVKNGDWLWLGPPGDPDSVCIQCHFEEWVEVLPDAVAGGAPQEGEAGAAPEEDEPPIPVLPIDAYEPVTPGDVSLDAPAPEGFEPTAAVSVPPAPEGFEPTAAVSVPPAPEGFEPTAAESVPASPEPVSFEPPAPEVASAPPEPVSFEPPAPEAASAPPEPVSFEPPVPEAASASPEPVSFDAPAPESPPAPSAAAPPPPPPPPPPAEAAEEALFVEAEPPVAATPVEAPAPPPATEVEEPLAEDDAFFVEAEPQKAPAPPPPPPPPPPGAGDASDPFFLDEAAAGVAPDAKPPAPVAPETPVASTEDHFFIAGDALTDAAEPTDTPVLEEPEAELLATEAEAIVLPGDELPGPEVLNRAPLPPRQGEDEAAAEEPIPTAEILPEALPEPMAPLDPPPPPPPPAPPPPPEPLPDEAPDDEILAAEAVPEIVEPEPVPEEPVPPAAPAPPDPGDKPEPAPEERPRPAGARRGGAGAGRRPVRRRPKGGPPAWLKPVGLGAGLALVVGVVGLGLWSWLGRTVSVQQVSPSRVRVGQRATLTGEGFSTAAAENIVLFGDVTARVLSAAPNRLEVAVPEAVAEAGTEKTVPVTVRIGDRSSEPVEVSVFQGPRLHGLSPDVAMPGEEVLLAGAGWGIGASVRFGDVPAEIVATEATQIRVVVPQIPGYGTSAPAVVSVGGVDSNAAPFYVGRLPLVTGVTPRSVRPGDRLTIAGRGLSPDPAANGVRIDGTLALIVAARADQLEVVTPRLGPGETARPLEVHVAGTEEPGRTDLEVAIPTDPLELRFVAEPFDQETSRDLAVVTTDLGPAFVLAAANGRTAAERAAEAQDRLNAAVASLGSSPGLVPEARDLTTRPSIALAGQPEPLLEVSEADAAAYNEDWTRLRGQGGPVTPARLARWWEAVTRDLVLMLVRGERPQFAAALAPEGRVLQQVFDAGSGADGIPRQVVSGASSSLRNGLRLVGLRVPASVTAAVPPSAGEVAPAAAPTPTPVPLALEGQWSGSEVEQGRRRYLTVTFRRNRGSIAYEGGITLTVPFLSLERPGRNRVRFSVEMRGGVRHYAGEWDGEKLSGDISRDEAGRSVVGTFELRPR